MLANCQAKAQKVWREVPGNDELHQSTEDQRHRRCTRRWCQKCLLVSFEVCKSHGCIWALFQPEKKLNYKLYTRVELAQIKKLQKIYCCTLSRIITYFSVLFFQFLLSDSSFREYLDCSEIVTRRTCGAETGTFIRGFLKKMSSTLEEDYCQEYYQAGDNQCPNLHSSSTVVFSSSNIVKSIVITLVTSLISLRLHWAGLHMHTTFTQQWNYSLNSIWNSHFNLMKKLFHVIWCLIFIELWLSLFGECTHKRRWDVYADETVSFAFEKSAVDIGRGERVSRSARQFHLTHSALYFRSIPKSYNSKSNATQTKEGKSEDCRVGFSPFIETSREIWWHSRTYWMKTQSHESLKIENSDYFTLAYKNQSTSLPPPPPCLVVNNII